MAPITVVILKNNVILTMFLILTDKPQTICVILREIIFDKLPPNPTVPSQCRVTVHSPF